MKIVNLEISVLDEKDTSGNPIFVIDGRKFFHQPVEMGKGNDHIWESEYGDTLTLVGPTYTEAQYTPAGLFGSGTANPGNA